MSNKEWIILLLFLGVILSLITLAYLSDLKVDQIFQQSRSPRAL